MYRKRRAYITAEEVVEVAAALKHPDAQLGAEYVALSTGSSFLSLIDLGIFSRSGTAGYERFSFVYETYFEFSLGRYIAFVRWRNLTSGLLEYSQIETDLKTLIDEHSRLSKDGNFSNLFGAIQFAILATESGEWMNVAGRLPVEERIYHNHPELFSKLIGCLAETKKGFDWLQQACATIRESELANRETWNRLESQNNTGKAKEQFGELLAALDNLAGMTDFVLLWDIENTLQTLAGANFGLTLAHIKGWSKSDDRLKIIFASQVISRLALIDPENVIELLLELIKTEKLRTDFWISRTLLFTVSEITRINRKNKLEEHDDWLRLREQIYRVMEENLQGEISPYTGSRTLALLPDMSFSQTAELNKIDSYIEKLLTERDAWQLLNLVFNLAELPDEDFNLLGRWIVRTLDKIAEHRNHHVWYAIEKVIDSIDERKIRNQEILDFIPRIKAKLKGQRWRTDVNFGIIGSQSIHPVGIVYSPKYLEPDYENHIECRERLLAILNKLEGSAEDKFTWIAPREASKKDLVKAHNPGFDFHRDGARWNNYVETIEEISANRLKNKERLERTGASELRFESFDIAKLAAGGVMSGIDYVNQNNSLAAVVLNRPPGHLANNTICIFNNIAVGAHYAFDRYSLERILIVDCDAHHGKHTQQVFYRSPNVVYFSMHIDGDYAKEAGMIENDGEDDGKGYTFNIPYPPNMSDEGYEFIIDNLLMPVALDFKPQLILLSAGFDGHFDDPLTPVCLLSEQSYIYLARKLKEIAAQCDCKIVAALEGGYGLEGMSNSLAQMLNVWGNWNREEKIGFTKKPDCYKDRIDPEAVQVVRKKVLSRIKMMCETQKENDGYFFNPSAAHWQNNIK
jgi:acetoin utilization deacetylase AcuC-like enzyme